MNKEQLAGADDMRNAYPGQAGQLLWPEEKLWIVLCISIIALTALRLLANIFANTDLFFDEAQYWFWSQELAFGYYSKPPLIGWVIRGATEICGQGEACIRAPSALFHAGTAFVIFGIGSRLYNRETGFWSGLIYITLPGVSVSASLISTDALLLFFVALALLSFLHIRAGGSYGWALLFGIAIGFGFLAKYAMVYFLLCLALWLIWSSADRKLLADGRLYLALVIGLAILSPNIVWNTQNGFATLSHTADNANWAGINLHPNKALEFFGGQFGVFGPILFTALLVYSFHFLVNREKRRETGQTEKMLLTFSVPVIVLMTMQGLLSRAHANWAAFAYIAATVLITAVMLRGGRIQLFRASLILHLVLAFIIGAGGILAGRVAPPIADPFARVLGWQEIAQSVKRKVREGGFAGVATRKRALAAELLYYLRNDDIPVYVLRRDGPPRDHFEMTRPLTRDAPQPVLIVSFRRKGPEGAQSLGQEMVSAGPRASRTLYFHALGETVQ